MTDLFLDNICADSDIMQIVECVVVGMGLIIIVFIGFIGHRKINASKPGSLNYIFKYMFYSCNLLAMISLFLFAINITICYTNILPYTWSYIFILSSFAIYAIIIAHLYICWLFRLHLTFNGTSYDKSTIFYVIICMVFTFIALSAISGLILYILSIEIMGIPGGALLVIISAFGYFLVSIWLLQVFLRQLLEIVTCKIVTVRFQTKASLQDRTSKIDLSFKDQRMIHLIAKYFVLGAASFTATLLVLIGMLLQLIFLNIFGANYNNIMFHVLQLLIKIDVVTNIICLYLQFNFANLKYKKICGWFDKKIHGRIENKAVQKIRRDTFTFYAKKFADSLHKSQHSNNVSLGDMELPVIITELNVVTTTSQESKTSECNMSMDFDKLMNFKTVRSATGMDKEGVNGLNKIASQIKNENMENDEEVP